MVAVIGILAAIAIPQFTAYKQRGYNAAAKVDATLIRLLQPQRPPRQLAETIASSPMTMGQSWTQART